MDIFTSHSKGFWLAMYSRQKFLYIYFGFCCVGKNRLQKIKRKNKDKDNEKIEPSSKIRIKV